MILSSGREPLFIPDTHNHELTKQLNITKEAKIRSYIGVPIILNDDKLYGTLCAIDPEPNVFQEGDVNVISTFATFVANAIDLKHAYTQINQQRQKMLNDYQMAKRVQSSVLSEPIDDNNISMSAFYKSSELLSGDMYCWYPIDSHRYGIVLLDVMGHGVSASLVSMTIRSLLYPLVTRLIDPAKVLQELNKHILHLFNDENDLTTYVTIFYMIIDTKNKTIEYVNAGHPAPIVISDNQYIEMPASIPPLGIFEDDLTKSISVKISDQTNIILYTDGLQEVIPFNEGRMTENIIKAYEASKSHLEGLEGYLNDNIKRFDFLPDDVCLLSIKLKTT